MFLDGIAVMIDWFLGWPFIFYVTAISILCTVMLRGIQFRRFFDAVRITFSPPKAKSTGQDMSPLQAFLNTLNINLGNGSLAGMAVAVATGGPGAAIWVIVTGFLFMAVRFCEVYLSTWFGAQQDALQTGIGGPMLYLEKVPGGKVLSYLYAILSLMFGCIIGNAMQANSITLSLHQTWQIIPLITASLLGIVVLYILLGGAARIVKVSDTIVPVKVCLFFFSTLAVLVYHYQMIFPALKMIFISAFNPMAVAGGFFGYTIQQVIRVGISKSFVATESGLGSAAIFFGYTGSKDAMGNGLLGMMGTFVGTLVCFLIVLAITASGAWQTGFSSTPLTIAAYSTLFGKAGGWIVSFLSISFGLGVLVAYAYVTRACWLFLTGERFAFGHIILYAGSTVLGALIDVKSIWVIIEIVNASLAIVNLFGIVYLLPALVQNIKKEERKSHGT